MPDVSTPKYREQYVTPIESLFTPWIPLGLTAPSIFAVYELGVKHKRTPGAIIPVYAGKTVNLRRRMLEYVDTQSPPHIYPQIALAKRQGFTLFYRCLYCFSAQSCSNVERCLLKTYDYLWNTSQNMRSSITNIHNNGSRRFDYRYLKRCSALKTKRVLPLCCPISHQLSRGPVKSNHSDRVRHKNRLDKLLIARAVLNASDHTSMACKQALRIRGFDKYLQALVVSQIKSLHVPIQRSTPAKVWACLYFMLVQVTRPSHLPPVLPALITWLNNRPKVGSSKLADLMNCASPTWTQADWIRHYQRYKASTAKH